MYGVAVTPDSRWVISHALDGTVQIWDLITGSRLLIIAANNFVKSVAVSPIGNFFVTASMINGVLHIWSYEYLDGV